MRPSYAGRATLPAMADDDLTRIAAARGAYAALAPRISAGEPWPLATAFGTEPEASWGPREVLAHVAEMLPFWLGELERVVDGDGQAPIPFGRTAEDQLRIGTIERDRTLPLRVLFERVDAGIAAWQRRLPALSDTDQAKVGLHPRLGELPAPGIADRFIVGHLEDHIAQLETILTTAGR